MRLRLTGAALLATAALPATALAQAGDASGRYDVDEVLRRHPHDLDNLPTREEAAGRAVTFEASLGGTFTTDAGVVRDAVAAPYATPGLAIDITPVTVAGWDFGAGGMIDADYYSGSYNNRFGEGRLEGFVFASRSLGPGTLTGEVILHNVYTNDFADHDLRLLISALAYSVQTGPVRIRGVAEYEDADIPEERRLRLASTVAYAFPQPTWGYDVQLEGGLAFSDFNGGANANRNDVVASLALTADRKLGSGWSLEWETALINRFSNRERSRFTAFDLGVQLARRF